MKLLLLPPLLKPLSAVVSGAEPNASPPNSGGGVVNIEAPY
jgi:hypothetical protein